MASVRGPIRFYFFVEKKKIKIKKKSKLIKITVEILGSLHMSSPIKPTNSGFNLRIHLFPPAKFFWLILLR
jgi:hypothetical protein